MNEQIRWVTRPKQSQITYIYNRIVNVADNYFINAEFQNLSIRFGLPVIDICSLWFLVSVAAASKLINFHHIIHPHFQVLSAKVKRECYRVPSVVDEWCGIKKIHIRTTLVKNVGVEFILMYPYVCLSSTCR